jgi:hypothetical protein
MALFRRKPKAVPVDLTAGDPRAAQLVDAVESDDADGIRSVLGEATSVDERERLTMLLTQLSGHPQPFESWVEREPDNPTAWLARAAHGIGYAWDARGAGYADTVGKDGWTMFLERLRRAEGDLLRAAEYDRGDAVPWSMMLISGRGLEAPKEELLDRYEQAQARHPWLLEAHLQLLQSLCQKWLGSDDEALGFARAVARDAPDGAAVLAVVPIAHIEIWLDMDRRDGADPDEYMRRPEVREEIQEAARRSVFADGFADDLVTVPALNIFAVGLDLVGDGPGAAALVQRLGDRRAEFPWAYLLGDPGQRYAELLAA